MNQRRLKTICSEKDAKENELKEIYTEFDDALSKLDACVQQ